MKIHRVWQLIQRAGAAVREMNEAQKRLLALRMAADRYLVNPDSPPDTYAEFLFRTSGALLHEPTASERTDPRGAR